MPVFCNVLWPSLPEAIAAPCADIELGFCPNCQFIYNTAFDPTAARYDGNYSNPLHFSPTFVKYADELADSLVARYDLHDKDIVEIGCSDGEFLSSLCAKGSNRGVGFDPSYLPDETAPDNGPVTIIPEYFTPETSAGPVDFLCCRHVLEHIEQPLEFLTGLARTIKSTGISPVYFEIPNGLYMLESLAIWDIIYEHCGYYTPAALTNLFQLAGFDVLEIHPAYGDQFLAIEAAPANGQAKAETDATYPQIDSLVDQFSRQHRIYIETWQSKLGKLATNSARTVIWGTGSKGVTFLNALHIGTDQIEFAVDANPNKAGQFVPRTGQEIVAPAALCDYKPEAVIVMNGIYRDEIAGQLAEMGIEAQVLTA